MGLFVVVTLGTVVLLELTTGYLLRRYGPLSSGPFFSPPTFTARSMELEVVRPPYTKSSFVKKESYRFVSPETFVYDIDPTGEQRKKLSITHPQEKLKTDVEPFGRVGKNKLRLPVRSYRETQYAKIDGDTPSVMMDITYSIDAQFRRVSSREAAKKNAGNFLMLIGDSNIYGIGVSDTETLGANLNELLPNHRIYNYAIAGVYPGDLLERVRLIDKAEIREKGGTAVYFFADYHMGRNIGAISQLKKTRGAFRPYYYEDKDGEIVSKGVFIEEKPLWTHLAKWLANSNIVNYFNLDVRPREADWRFQARLIEKIRERTKELGAEHFVVVLYPHSSEATRLMPYLEKAKINYIDLSKWSMPLLTNGPYHVPYDPHFSPESNALIAKAIAPAIEKLTRQEPLKLSAVSN